MIQKQNVPYTDRNESVLDLYVPDTESFPAVLYIHGGGFVSGKRNSPNINDFALEYVENGYGFLTIDYSLYPGAKYPDYLYDCADAVKYALDHLTEYGWNGKLYISGQSAGAWAALMLCLNRTYLTERGVDPDQIAGWIIDSAQTTSHFNVQKYELGEDPRRQLINEFAPLYYVDEHTAFSRMLLIWYEEDMPCRPEQNELFLKTVKVFCPDADIKTVVLPGGHVHGCVKNPDGTYDYMKEALKWLKEV